MLLADELIWYSPFELVEVPVFVPFTTTEAPTIGWLVSFVMRPLTVMFCANAGRTKKADSTKSMTHAFTFPKSPREMVDAFKWFGVTEIFINNVLVLLIKQSTGYHRKDLNFTRGINFLKGGVY
jgi:hypothetical protein